MEMKNRSSVKTNSTESPKTPGGISKSLLTPCRRLGLSRNWKKSGPSPFISPLSSVNSNTELKQENEPRKRKQSPENSEIKPNKTGEHLSEQNSIVSCNTPKIDSDRTPSRTLLPRKKSKTILITTESQDEVEKLPQSISELNSNKNFVSNDNNLQQDPIKHGTKVSKLSRKNSLSKLKILQSPSTVHIEPKVSGSSNCNKDIESVKNKLQVQNKETDNCVNIKENNPNNLTKECIVVIQKKIFKTDKLNEDTSINDLKTDFPPNKSTSQTLFDSDTDDVPLANFNKTDKLEPINEACKKRNTQKLEVEDLTKCDKLVDNDFIEKKLNNKRLENKTYTSELKTKQKKINKTKAQTKPVPKPPSQSSNSFEDEDDDFTYDKRKTIVIKKTYDKIAKPLKAKSTGSITQKDIEDIKARIESKKNLLLAQSMSHETQELRDLIKKWQTGCQTALMELLELMKKKMPEHNMGHSELLQMLKIPPDLVGYDSESDCFNTPDDANIILSALKLE